MCLVLSVKLLFLSERKMKQPQPAFSVVQAIFQPHIQTLTFPRKLMFEIINFLHKQSVWCLEYLFSNMMVVPFLGLFDFPNQHCFLARMCTSSLLRVKSRGRRCRQQSCGLTRKLFCFALNQQLFGFPSV